MMIGAFQQKLGSREIPVKYDGESYEEDLGTLEVVDPL